METRRLALCAESHFKKRRLGAFVKQRALVCVQETPRVNHAQAHASMPLERKGCPGALFHGRLNESHDLNIKNTIKNGAQRKASPTARFEYEGVPCELTFGPGTTVLVRVCGRRSASSFCWKKRQTQQRKQNKTSAVATRLVLRVANSPLILCCPRTYCTSCSRMFYLCTCDW